VMKYFFKRAFDVISVLIGLILLWPLLLVVAVIIRIKLGSPVIFKQQRPGLDGNAFCMYKLRTMTNATDAKGNLMPDEKRLPAFGKFLRSTSLDELPELFCVLNGDMSLVGPRPLMMKYLPRYTPQQARRHEVKPGITGWAQINGRNAISWEEKFDLDVWYVDNWNMWVDIKILFKTVAMVFKRHGITEEGSATIEQFMGTEQKIDSNEE